MTAFAGNDRFVVLSQLGVGGMGVVYEARDRERDMRVALKTLRMEDPAQLLRFKREFRALRDLRHPNLVELGELFEDSGSWFFTMELIEGVDFRTHVRGPDPAAQRLDEDRLRGALAGLAAGLTALHRAGKVHCDIKPSNVLVTPAGRVVVLDFGVVAELEHSDDPRSGRIVGSPLYMAPEQIKGKPVGPAADWYAVGVLLFEALTGQAPFSGSSAGAILGRKLRQPAPHPADLAPDAPADLLRLCKRLLARAPSRRPGEAEILAALGVDDARAWPAGAAGQRLFVGRKDALNELWRAYRDTRQGRAVSLFIEGESGVGKTALVEHFVDQLREEPGAVILRGQCHEREFVPYNAFDGIVDGMASYLRARPWDASFTGAAEMLAPLLHIFPVLRGAPGFQDATRPRASTGGDARRLAFFALRQVVSWIAGNSPLVLVVDDVHWADADSLMLLGELLGGRAAPPLLLLATARKLDRGRSCPALRAVGGDIRRIELSGLRGDEAEELAQRLFQHLSDARIHSGSGGAFERPPGRAPVDIGTVIAETGGHPMFMDELVRYMARHAGPSSRARAAHLDDALRDRIAGLEPGARRLLDVIAVAGAPLLREIIAEAAELSAEDVAHWLHVLRVAKLVRTSGPEQEVEVGAYHARVRDAVYGRLDPDQRRALHGRLAAVLEARGTESVQLVSHYQRAGQPGKAAYHAMIAARKAAESLAFDQAAELYKVALEAAPERDPDDRRTLLTELGLALQNAGRTREAAEAYTAAARGAGAADALDLSRRAAEQLLVGGYLDEGAQTLRKVTERVGMRLPPSSKRMALQVAWSLYTMQRRAFTWRQPDGRSEPGADVAEVLSRIDVCWTLSVGLSLVDPLRGTYFGLRGMRLSLRAGEPFRIARSLGAVSIATAALGKPQSSVRIHQAAVRAAREHGSADAELYADIARLVYAFFYQQAWRDCVAAGREFERRWHAAGKGHGFELDFVILFCSWAQGMLGDMSELARFVDMFVSDARRVGNRLLEVNLRASHGLVHLAADDPDRAAADITDAIDSWLPGHEAFRLPHVWALLSRIDIQLYRGRPFDFADIEPDIQRLRRSLLRKTRWVLWQESYLAGRVALARAAELSRAGKPSQARRHIRKARAMARRLRGCVAPVPRYWGALLRAGSARVQSDDDRAARALRTAVRGLDQSDTQLHAAAARYRLDQTLGGSEGDEHRDQARASMRELGVTNPERIVAMLAPGW